MKRLSATTHISIGITFLTLSLLLAAQGLGVIPSPNQAALHNRKQLCESVAIQCSVAAQRDDKDAIRDVTKAIVARYPEILSAGLRDANGNLTIEVNKHTENWK